MGKAIKVRMMNFNSEGQRPLGFMEQGSGTREVEFVERKPRSRLWVGAPGWALQEHKQACVNLPTTNDAFLPPLSRRPPVHLLPRRLAQASH